MWHTTWCGCRKQSEAREAQRKEGSCQEKEGRRNWERCPPPPPLKDWEEKLLQFIGMEVVSGNEGGLVTSVTGVNMGVFVSSSTTPSNDLTNQMINHAWKRIADIVSNVCGIPRSVDDFRNKVKQEKCKIKKKAAKTRKEGG